MDRSINAIPRCARNASFADRVAPARRGLLACLAALAIAGAATPVHAAEIEGVEFAEQVTTGDLELKLHGVGLLKYMVFVKAYVAGLYLGPGCTAENVLADAPKRLEISYFWDIAREDFISVTRTAIQQNLTEAEFASLRDQVEQFVNLYQAVTPGDRYSLTYVPGVGTELALNGTALGVIEGAELGAAVFAIWFGDAEIDGKLKAALLASAG